MTNTERTAATKRVPMDSLRKTSLLAGVLYLLTFVSIPTPFILYKSVLASGYVNGPGPDTAAQFGGILEVIVALAGVGTALVLYPVVKRQNQSAALGFIAARTLEAATIIVGVVSILTIVNLRRAGAGADAAVTGQALSAMYDSTFMLGQSLMPAINALLLGTLLYRSRLVPRILPTLGLIGAPLLLAADIATIFGVIDRVSPLAGLGALPIAVWEFSLGVYLLVKGFRPSPITAGMVPASAPPAYHEVAA